MVMPFLLSLTLTSPAVPVSEPSGSPLVLASAIGTGAPATSASVIGFGAGVAAAAAAGAAVGACPKPNGAQQSTTAHKVSSLFVVIFILASPLLPDCILKIGPIENTDDAEQTDG